MKLNTYILDKFEEVCKDDSHLLQCLKNLFVFELREQGQYMNYYESQIKEHAEKGGAE